MPSTAITAQRSVVKIETASAATKAITGATAASPPVITAVGHGYVTDDIVQLDDLGGMAELNGRAYRITVLTVDTFSLNGIDATGYTAYTSGGTAAKKTMTRLGNIKDFNIDKDSKAQINVTNLDSIAQEFRLGLAGSWTMSLAMDIDTADTGQAECAQAEDDGVARVFTITLSNGKVWAGVGYVDKFTTSGNPDDVVKGGLNLRGTNRPSYFA